MNEFHLCNLLKSHFNTYSRETPLAIVADSPVYPVSTESRHNVWFIWSWRWDEPGREVELERERWGGGLLVIEAL